MLITVYVGSLEVEVDCDYTPGVEPITDRLPEDCDPGEPADLQLNSATICSLNGTSVDLLDLPSEVLNEHFYTRLYLATERTILESAVTA